MLCKTMMARYLVKLLIALLAAVAWSLLQPLAIDLALTDALAERLDGINGPNTRAVAEYLESTILNRTIGFGIILSIWAVVVLGISFVVDEVFSKRGASIQSG
jgi:hypothetical protein